MHTTSVIGALIGVQNGREIEIVNSFELALTPDGQDVNHEFFATRQAQCGWSVTLKGMALRMAEDTIFDSETPSTAYNLSVKQVFPSFEFRRSCRAHASTCLSPIPEAATSLDSLDWLTDIRYTLLDCSTLQSDGTPLEPHPLLWTSTSTPSF